jgi:hypothetical protein
MLPPREARLLLAVPAAVVVAEVAGVAETLSDWTSRWKATSSPEACLKVARIS